MHLFVQIIQITASPGSRGHFIDLFEGSGDFVDTGTATND